MALDVPSCKAFTERKGAVGAVAAGIANATGVDVKSLEVTLTCSRRLTSEVLFARRLEAVNGAYEITIPEGSATITADSVSSAITTAGSDGLTTKIAAAITAVGITDIVVKVNSISTPTASTFKAQVATTTTVSTTKAAASATTASGAFADRPRTSSTRSTTALSTTSSTTRTITFSTTSSTTKTTTFSTTSRTTSTTTFSTTSTTRTTRDASLESEVFEAIQRYGSELAAPLLSGQNGSIVSIETPFGTMTLALLQESSSSEGVALVEVRGLGLAVAMPKGALPQNILGKLAISVITLPTGSTSNSSRRLPRKGDIEESEHYWESAIITGPVFDITLVSVDSGVKPVPVQNLDEPILIRLSASRFESGTRCRYRNSLTGWSSDGVSVATEEEIRAFLFNPSNALDRANASDGLKEGFWCATYHLSMFAPVKIIQNPPLVEALSRSKPLLTSASWLLALIPIGLFLCTITLYVVARCRVMKGGSVEMATQVGGVRDVRFKINRPSTSTSSSSQGAVKTQVVWDIKPKLFFPG
ncbi:unnamed protein product [Polarella glacialis]|uniref:Uncharacterized protein n=1 Tax=Polarella glacialis TaxID=89957 RepID=A0A813E9E7_POLGL|nr:unnamed protein product [Polarella glacialis]